MDGVVCGVWCGVRCAPLRVRADASVRSTRSGNYSNALYIFSRAGKRKLDAALALGPKGSGLMSQLGKPPLEHLGPHGLGLLDERRLHMATWRQLAAMFYMQLNTRIMPKLIAAHFNLGGGKGDKVRTLADFGLISHGMLLNQWLLGMCSHEIKYVPFVMELRRAPPLRYPARGAGGRGGLRSLPRHSNSPAAHGRQDTFDRHFLSSLLYVDRRCANTRRVVLKYDCIQDMCFSVVSHSRGASHHEPRSYCDGSAAWTRAT